MALFNEWSKKISKLAAAQYEASTINEHSSILGEAREAFVQDILKRFLPENVSIGTGEIIDSTGKRSNQIDVVVYRNDFPVLNSGGSSSLYLVEGVLAAIEVKSTLNEAKLLEALENVKSVKNLKPSFLSNSLNMYSQEVYEDEFNDLRIPQKNSMMGMLLPATYIFSYKGYKRRSLDKLINSINKWYCSISDGGEYAADALPEAIVTEGCIAFTNLGNQLGIEKADQSELVRLLKEINSKGKSNYSVDDLFDFFNIDENEGFKFGLGVKADENPLQYLISSMLETIILRLGQQQYGSLPIVYSLMDYHMTNDMEGNWQGAALNASGITCPRQDFLNRLFLIQNNQARNT